VTVFILTAIGVGIGVPLAILVARALTSALYGVQPYDAWSYARLYWAR
jgi:hypothetical protein